MVKTSLAIGYTPIATNGHHRDTRSAQRTHRDEVSINPQENLLPG